MGGSAPLPGNGHSYSRRCRPHVARRSYVAMLSSWHTPAFRNAYRPASFRYAWWPSRRGRPRTSLNGALCSATFQYSQSPRGPSSCSAVARRSFHSLCFPSHEWATFNGDGRMDLTARSALRLYCGGWRGGSTRTVLCGRRGPS